MAERPFLTTTAGNPIVAHANGRGSYGKLVIDADMS